MSIMLSRLGSRLPEPARVWLRKVRCATNMLFPAARDENECRRLLWLATSGIVVSGPFAGTRTSGVSFGSSYLPKLLGTYEKELHWLWTPERLGAFRAIINVGCAEGFYLAGIAHLLRRHGLPLPRLFGFDLDRDALAAAAELLRLNGCKGFTLSTDGWADCLIRDHSPFLVLCDIEGAETSALDPLTVPQLKSAHIVCEVHDDPGRNDVRDLLIQRFRDSHRIEECPSRPRTLADYPSMTLCRFDASARLALMDEHRWRGNWWLYLEPREQPGGSS